LLIICQILSDLVGAEFDDQKALIAPTVRDFSYIGIFPLTSHFNCLVQNLPRLDRLYTQFVPRNEIIHDRKKMYQVEATDLWTERNGCYTILMRELFNAPPEDNYRYLKEFESGDAADRDACKVTQSLFCPDLTFLHFDDLIYLLTAPS
jgi:hypothetical protein